MGKCNLKSFTNTATFNIFDEWNHQLVETLPASEALEKYGDCMVWSSYTSGVSKDGYTTDVWLEIPGMKIGAWNGDNLHLHFIGSDEQATFIGAKSGDLITITKWGEDDYDAWWRDPGSAHDPTAGCSVRGTAKEIINELKEEI